MIKAAWLPGAEVESEKNDVRLNSKKTMLRESSMLHTSHLQVRHCLVTGRGVGVYLTSYRLERMHRLLARWDAVGPHS
jgi:hypothetical protein